MRDFIEFSVISRRVLIFYYFILVIFHVGNRRQEILFLGLCYYRESLFSPVVMSFLNAPFFNRGRSRQRVSIILINKHHPFFI